MKIKNLIPVFTSLTFLTLAFSATAQDLPGTPRSGAVVMDQSTMSMLGMFGIVDKMTTQNKDMADLMTKLTQSIAAIQNEKDPAVLKSRITEHAALLAELDSRLTQAGDTIQKLSNTMPHQASGTMPVMQGPMPGIMPGTGPVPAPNMDTAPGTMPPSTKPETH